MIKRILTLIGCLLFYIFATSQQIVLTGGLKISKSATVKKGNYILPAGSGSTAVIVIEGNDIVVDFNNAVVKSGLNTNQPDRFVGIALIVKNGRNITIKNLKAHGYKVALMGTNVKGLKIENCDFSYNYRKHLNSTQEKEDLSDWMSYDQNEKDEWLRYGAAIYLRGCDSLLVKDCKVTGGQNALMLTQCNDGLIYNNDFSFNSGVGIGMYLSSRNNVMYNRLVFNVRGYSHGVYNRGQDSAAILVYEQSNGNMFYRNNATHSGDGFFLWAGQSTMETGQGGCNDNFIVQNDFSYAPTNGIEVTFSRNYIFNNRIYGCDHGIWGGYSYETSIANNQFRNNRIAIAIEHGQRNRIYRNVFASDQEAVRLWARAQQPADWGYAKLRDTRSVDYSIIANSFNNHETVFNFSRTDSISIFDNTVSESSRTSYKIDSTVTNLDTFFLQSRYDEIEDAKVYSVFQPDDPKDPFAGSGKFAGREKIRMTEWGPYDYSYPIIWHSNPSDKTDTLKFDVLGPAGKWKVQKQKGMKVISPTSGTVPARILAIRERTVITDIYLQLQFTARASYKDIFGKQVSAKKPVILPFRKYFKPMNWGVLFYSLDTSFHNPITTGQLFSMVERKAPFKTDSTDRLSYAWWGGVRAGETQHQQFMTVSSARSSFTRGRYEISVTWDDAVRVYVDNRLVLDEWNPGKYTFDESPNRKVEIQLDGNHDFRVDHLELGGFATLDLTIKPVRH